MRATLSAALLTLALALLGCGNSTDPPMSTVSEGTTVDADRYLADSAAGAAAVRAFVAELATVESPATPERLKEVAPRLAPPLATATLVGQRLSAERLADRRLDEQRERNAAAYAGTVSAMQRVHQASQDGNPVAVKSASEDLDRSLDVLRQAPAK